MAELQDLKHKADEAKNTRLGCILQSIGAERLVECPCCKGDAALRNYNRVFFVKCPDCGLQTADCTTKEDAIARWNRRD